MEVGSTENVEACLNNPGFQVMTLRCLNSLRVYITSVSVGKAWIGCDSHFCVYGALKPDHVYFQNLTRSCDGKPTCTISATELNNISKIVPYIFEKCGNDTPAYNDRNKVMVDYICSGEFHCTCFHACFIHPAELF